MKGELLKDKKRSCIRLGLSKAITMLGFTIGLLWSTTFTQEVAAKEVAKVDTFHFTTKEQIPSTIDTDMDYPYSYVSEINEFWGTDNQYYITYSGKSMVYISILDEQMQLQKTLEIEKDLPLVGNIIQDQSGNFYIVYGKYDTADMYSDSTAGSAVVMSIVQYDNTGKQLKKLTYQGRETGQYDGVEWGTKEPFNFANCDLVIDTKGVLVCRYGRVMYNGHQSSHALYVDTSTMTKLKYIAPYTSHSLGQKVIATTDGSYLMVDRGDGYDRGFQISKVNQYTKDMWSIPSFVPFHFRNGYIYQTTYAVLGGLAECTNGYALSGVSEKTLSYDIAKDPEFNESRNLFLQVFSKNFTSKSSNRPEVQLLKGDTRTAEGTYQSIQGGCEEGAVDYGVLWLTNYTGKYYASNPKMIPIGEDKLLFMWEKKQYDPDKYDHFVTSYYMVVSSTGDIIIPETEVQAHLTTHGEPAFRDGYVYWTISDGESKEFTVHRLTIGATMRGYIKLEKISIDKTDYILRAGQKIKLDIKFIPENADNKKLIFDYYDDSNIHISEDGYVTVLGQGDTEVYVWPEDKEEEEIRLRIVTTDNAPSKLKAANVAPIYYNADYMVKLTWTKSALGDEYEVYRSTKKNSGYVKVATEYDCEYYDDDVIPGKTYYYKVKSANYYWQGKDEANPMSNIATINVVSQMKNVKASKLYTNTVQISWSKLKDATGYEIYQYDSKSKKFKLIKTITSNTVTTYKKSGLDKGATYYFKVRAYRTLDGVKYYNTYSDKVSVKM